MTIQNGHQPLDTPSEDLQPSSETRPEADTVHQVRRAVADRLHDTSTVETTTLSRVVDEEITHWVRDQASHGIPPPSTATERHLAHLVLAALSGLGRLAPLLQRDDVENIHIHGSDRIWLELADGRVTRWPLAVADSDDELLELFTALFARSGQTSREWSPARPIGNLRLADGGPLGARVAALQQVTNRPRIAIRRHRLAHSTLDDLHQLGTLTEAVRQFLSAAVAAGLNLLVTGGPAAGKTTLLRALCHDIPSSEHLVTVEDDYELGLHLDEARHPLVTPAEARTANAEGIGEITLDDLLKQALRHSPSRVIVGEVRGGEITSLLRALGNGAAGGMGTLHATSARAVPDRIAALGQLAHPPLPIAAAHRWSASALDLLVHVTRRDHPQTGARQRVVSEIVEVGHVGDADTPDLTTLFRPESKHGAVPAGPPSPELMARLEMVGLDRSLFDSDAPDLSTTPWGGDPR